MNKLNRLKLLKCKKCSTDVQLVHVLVFFAALSLIIASPTNTPDPCMALVSVIYVIRSKLSQYIFTRSFKYDSR